MLFNEPPAGGHGPLQGFDEVIDGNFPLPRLGISRDELIAFFSPNFLARQLIEELFFQQCIFCLVQQRIKSGEIVIDEMG